MSDMVAVRPIRTDADYTAAMNEVGELMTARAGTPEGDRLDVLSTLVEAYEADHYAIEAPDPITLIEYAMEQRGADRADLEPMIGGRGRVSEVLSRRRALSLTMIRKLNAGWNLPTDVLVRRYPLRAAPSVRVRRASGAPSRRSATN